MPQVDLILETYVHRRDEVVAARLHAAQLARRLWPDVRLRVSETRGNEGVRWEIADRRYRGSVEVWVEAISPLGCVLHTFTRLDPSGAAWPRWRALWRSRRARARQAAVLWRFKDDVEQRLDADCG